MTEVTQAAQRMRQWKQDVFHCNMQQVADDRMTLAEAWLAEHADDDEELITFNWFAQLTCRPKVPCVWLDTNRRIVVHVGGAVELENAGESFELPEVRTKGQLRLLLRALRALS